MRVIAWILLALAASGCARAVSDRELQRVARDWSMVIRASQVIPVYPLTEDLQPGDVFLVQVPIDRQQKVYRQRGFLPLDNLVLRVNPGGYLPFYRQSFEVGDDQTPLPKHWLKPGAENAWGTAPKATFPSYSFSVRSGGGFNVAVPVQGVPVGLSLLGGGAAAGTITIADARTYGVDTVSLHEDVRSLGPRQQVLSPELRVRRRPPELPARRVPRLPGRDSQRVAPVDTQRRPHGLGRRVEAGSARQCGAHRRPRRERSHPRILQEERRHAERHDRGSPQARGRSESDAAGRDRQNRLSVGRLDLAERDLRAPARHRLSRLRYSDPGAAACSARRSRPTPCWSAA